MCIDYHHESNSDPQISMGTLQCIGEALSDKVQVCPTALHVHIEVYVFLYINKDFISTLHVIQFHAGDRKSS